VRQDGPADAVGPEVADDGQLDPLPADDQERPAEAQSPDRSSAGRLWGYLAIYSLLRLALVAVLTAALMFFMPLIVALLFAIIVQLPLSWLLFSGPRRRVNDAIAQSSAQRRRERERLQSALSGDDFPA
jgi:Flp pilus assembly protein TadB